MLVVASSLKVVVFEDSSIQVLKQAALDLLNALLVVSEIGCLQVYQTLMVSFIHLVCITIAGCSA